MQDATRQKILTGIDSLHGLQVKSSINPDTVKLMHVNHLPAFQKNQITDTVSDCSRNIVADVTFYDSTSFIRNIRTAEREEFPYLFVSKSHELAERKHEILMNSLRDGTSLPHDQFKSDWIVPLILFSAFLLAAVRAVPGNFFRSIFRFLFMRGINENGSRDTGVLYQWQSTLLNLSAFTSVSLFCYLLMKHYNVSIPGVNGLMTWLILFGAVIVVVTLRHIVCNLTGSISDEPEIFREYIINIYQGYRAAGMVFLLLSVLILYTVLVPVNGFFNAGIALTGLIYLLRVIRLFLIFITRHVSILYLILYLCALEILPVVILVKYVTGLV